MADCIIRCCDSCGDRSARSWAVSTFGKPPNISATMSSCGSHGSEVRSSFSRSGPVMLTLMLYRLRDRVAAWSRRPGRGRARRDPGS